MIVTNAIRLTLTPKEAEMLLRILAEVSGEKGVDTIDGEFAYILSNELNSVV
jgi:hypothetical protein